MENLQTKNLTVIGVGNIGKILLRRLTEKNFPTEQLAISDSDREKLLEISNNFGVKTTPAGEPPSQKTDLFLITTPPPVVPEVVKSLAPHLVPGQLVVSFAAAISLEWLESLVPAGVGVARIMPNAPSIVGAGCNPVAYGNGLSDEHQSLIQELLDLLGMSISVPDDKMNWCVGLTGAAMRSVLPVLEGMTRAGEQAGLSTNQARSVAAQILIGTGEVVRQTDLSFDQIKGLTPMQTVDEEHLMAIFQDAARQAKEKIDNFQNKLES